MQVRTLATHEVVQRVFPRPVTERDEYGMAAGKAIDEMLSHFSHDHARGLRPTVTAAVRRGEETLTRELEEAHLPLPSGDLEAFRGTAAEVLRVFRRSDLFGLPRPRTRLVLINGDAGLYAQPDFWDRRSRIFELKSYRALPPSPEVQLQLDLFQTAFPGFAESLVCLDRHSKPVALSVLPVSPLSEERTREILRLAHDLALEHGLPKVLEYVDSPVVRYTLPA